MLGQQQMFFNTSLSLVIAYSSFLIGEELLHVSGVITVLMAAIIFIRTWKTSYQLKISAGEAKESSDDDQLKITGAFWDYMTDIINGLIFFTLGVATGNHNFEDTPSFAVITAVAALIIARFIIVYGGSSILYLAKKPLPRVWQPILFLGGLKGGISAALILLIPHDYPYRGYFLCLAFAMIAFSLIVQPVLMKLYLNRTDLNG